MMQRALVWVAVVAFCVLSWWGCVVVGRAVWIAWRGQP